MPLIYFLRLLVDLFIQQREEIVRKAREDEKRKEQKERILQRDTFKGK